MPEAHDSLQITRHQAAGATLIQLRGRIDETFDRALFLEASDTVLVIDLDEVPGITSFGVREWCLALEELGADYYCFIRARPNLVSQFNMVAGFAGKGELVSFYSPSFCKACRKTIDTLIDLRKQHPAVRAFQPPVVTCSCGAQAAFDEDPEEYYGFAAQARVPDPPLAASALIDAGMSGPARRWRVQKEVEEGVTALWCSGPLDGKVSFRRVGEGLEGDVVMILADVSVRDAEGARALLQFASQGDYRLHLSDLPLELAPLFLKDRPPDANPRLLSFRVEMACKSCRKTVRLSLDSNRLTLLKTMGTVEEICQACAGPLAPSRPEKLQRISPSPCVAPPPAIRAYLERPREGGATRRPPRGEVLGRYRLGKKIGHGGMAEVFLARQHGPQGFEKRVVVKRLLPALADDKQFVEMFLREARLAARLSHPNIVQIFDLGQSGKTFFIAMEYVRGWDLNAVMKASVATNVRIPLQIACRIMSQVCAGLAYAHRPVDDEGKPMAIVHRDVSPQNILVSDQVVKLTDFGIAKAAGAITGTQPGMIRGKISYMAPEQVTKSGEVDGRVDIFATGVILYELVAGQRLFHRETQAGTLAAVLAGTVPPLSARRPEAVILEPILAKALQPDPNRRYQSADVMQADLEAVITRTGRPAGPAEVGAWLAGLSAAFKDVGGVAPVTSTTPTASAEVRLPTANLRTGTVGPGEDEHTVPSNKRDLERR